MPLLLDSVHPRYLVDLVDYLEEQGFSCTPALRSAGLTRAMLQQQQHVPIASVLKAMQELVQSSGRSDLGFVRGLLTHMSAGDLSGQMLLSARTLREALVNLAPYMPLISPVIRMQVQESGGDCIAEWTVAQPMPYDACVVELETVLVAFHRHVLFALQERDVRCKVEFSWSAPAHASRYRQFRGMEVRFGCGGDPRVTLRYPADLAERPLPMADARSLREADRAAQEHLQEIAQSHNFADWVRHVLHQVEEQLLTQEAVARLLRVSSKTLARHLAKENTRFGTIAQQVREERACNLLAQSAMPVGDIALKLGYATLANFSRGFKANTGLTPSEFRAKARSEDAG